MPGRAADAARPAAPRHPMQRICFQLQVLPDRLDEYRARHRAVWPEMLDALHEAGWRNYSLFLSPNGLLIGYLETDSFQEAQAAMRRTTVNERWQAEMAPFFGTRPDTGLEPLEEIFHLD